MSDEPDVQDAQTPAATPFIRTFAKDAASFGGATAAPEPATVAPQPQPQAPEPVVEPELPPAVIIPKAPTTNESREEVLARLRAKVGGKTPAPVAQPVRPASSSREEVLARLKKQATPTPKALEPIEAPAPIHTYSSDFQDKKRSTGASRISILAKQQDAAATREPVVLTTKKSNLPLIGGALLIILGIVSVTLAYQFVSKTPIIPAQLSVPSLIFADVKSEISGEGVALQQALVALEETELQDGEVLVAYVTYATTTADKTVIKEPATGGALIAALGFKAPDIVLRNIEPESTVGIVSAETVSSPFFILRVSSFERTFAGMLSWEKSLARDLSVLYPSYPVETPVVSTTTPATSTPPVVTFIPRFTDQVIANRDVRILKDEMGRSVLLYGYRDKETLIIARNEAAFRVLLERLSNSK